MFPNQKWATRADKTTTIISSSSSHPPKFPTEN
uniref:Uncharacterized protein n=1 Tax=Anguilla anguilla TaxID=7936 RepID=A0A0E9S437_ANGAN